MFLKLAVDLASTKLKWAGLVPQHLARRFELPRELDNPAE
jgi:hypothetical protein